MFETICEPQKVLSPSMLEKLEKITTGGYLVANLYRKYGLCICLLRVFSTKHQRGIEVDFVFPFQIARKRNNKRKYRKKMLRGFNVAAEKALEMETLGVDHFQKNYYSDS